MARGDMSWKTRNDGYEPVEDDEFAAVIMNTEKVMWYISPMTKGIIVPRWVFEAAETYKKAGGYAGMSLFQWLDRMADEQPPEPLHTF
jgi:hypothetical protein